MARYSCAFIALYFFDRRIALGQLNDDDGAEEGEDDEDEDEEKEKEQGSGSAQSENPTSGNTGKVCGL